MRKDPLLGIILLIICLILTITWGIGKILTAPFGGASDGVSFIIGVSVCLVIILIVIVLIVIAKATEKENKDRHFSNFTATDAHKLGVFYPRPDPPVIDARPDELGIFCLLPFEVPDPGIDEKEKCDKERSRRIPDNVKREVWRRDEGRCVECGSRERLEYHHIIPVSKEGSNTARNVELLCEKCNRSKSDVI